MLRRVCGVLLAGCLAAACGSDEGVRSDVDPVDLLAATAEVMVEVSSARFDMTRDGAPVTVQGMVFDGAVGEYQAPDAARAILRMRAGDLALEVGTISVGERTWVTNPLTGAWEELAQGTGFNPAVIFDADRGWRPLLVTDITDAEFLGTDGGTHRVRVTVSGQRIEVLTAGIAESQPVPLTIEIDAATGHIERLSFATQGPEGESGWVIELSAYDAAVDIGPPGGS